MKTYKIALTLFAATFIGFATGSFGAPNVGQPFRSSQDQGLQKHKMAAGCDQSKAQTDLNINNVRARIFSSGDMWWDLVGLAKYEVPKVTEANQISRTSLFAGSLWIGGFQNNNLKISAMTYRQSGVDFFPGPLDTVTATIDANGCHAWDNIYQVTSKEIKDFISDPAAISSDITNWPGNGNGYNGGGNISKHLAPYVDVNHNGIYDPENGDYPAINGNQALWYVYNDKGGSHTETKGDAIGLECQEMAFAFTTDDELNDMTFYKTTVINRSKNILDSTYFGQWVDPDLGYAFDDYVGCDTSLNLGYCYNGEDIDPGVTGYGKNPPSVGVGFFHGPVYNGKEIGLRKFLYYNNDANAINGNPGFPNSSPGDYYNYLTGHWKNGQSMKYGYDGVKGTVNTNFMFPGNPAFSDQSGGWTERSAGNKPGDRRFIESSGPFKLLPGAKNEVTVAVIWARAQTGGATGSLTQLKLDTKAAKNLYDNNFLILDGADAPDVAIRELDKKLVLSLENTNTKDVEKYTAPWVDNSGRKINYKFQGYLIYQLANSTVSKKEYNQPDKAQLIAQVDVKDSIKGQITNYVQATGFSGNVNQIMVDNQANAGLSHTFVITSDAFATGDKALVNYKSYYFSVISYSTPYPNLLADYDKNFVGSKLNVQTLIATPHNNQAEFGGTKLNSDYGSGPEITRIEGAGNGGNILEFTDATLLQILSNNHVANPTYQVGKGPVIVKVYDPTLIQSGNYEVKLSDSTIAATAKDGVILSENAKTTGTNHPQWISSGKWQVTNLDNSTTVKSDYTINIYDEKILSSGTKESPIYWGLSSAINQVYGPGGSDNSTNTDITNGFLEATMTFANESNRWLSGIENAPVQSSLPKGVPTPENWIRCGNANAIGFNNSDVTNVAAYVDASLKSDSFVVADPFSNYATLLGGIIAPAAVVARDGAGPQNSLTLGDIPGTVDYSFTKISNLNSIDLVFTPDRSKWSNCMVIEMGESPGLNEGGAAKFSLRKHASWKGDMDANGNPVYDNGSTGMSIFPGYAVNLETGDRLNVFFSEDSHLPKYNGADMLWNPTSDLYDLNAGYQDYISRYISGGKHWIYVMNSVGGFNGATPTVYDGCKSYAAVLNANPSQIQIKRLWSTAIWVMEPVLAVGSHLASLRDGIIPTEAKIRLRVAKPYATYNPNPSGTAQNANKPYYKFSTAGITPERTSTVGKDALANVGISPNPYYATSAYETSQLDNRVRFVNVPTKCEIAIYTIDGVLVRKFTKDETNSKAYKSGGTYPSTYLDWDLKNQSGVPIAGGVYLIHVNAYDLGEKIIKWFGVTKPLDLDTF